MSVQPNSIIRNNEAFLSSIKLRTIFASFVFIYKNTFFKFIYYLWNIHIL